MIHELSNNDFQLMMRDRNSNSEYSGIRHVLFICDFGFFEGLNRVGICLEEYERTNCKNLSAL